MYHHLQMKLKISKLKPVEFEWDKGNKDKNWQKHKVDYKECEQIFLNKGLKILYDIKHSQKEDRFIVLGVTNKDRKLIISFTIRDKRIRVASARDQSRKERRLYEQKTKA